MRKKKVKLLHENTITSDLVARHSLRTLRIYGNQNKKSLELRWNAYIEYCTQHILDAYNMITLKDFEDDILYVDGCGNFELKSNLTWDEYHGAYVNIQDNDIVAYYVYTYSESHL